MVSERVQQTWQDMFNHVWGVFVTSKAPYSATYDYWKSGQWQFACWYRYPGDPTRRCGVGVFIPDEQYDAAMEGKSAYYLVQNYPAVREALYGADYRELDTEDMSRLNSFLNSLQGAHDYAARSALGCYDEQPVYASEEERRAKFTELIEVRLRELAENWGLVVPEAKV